MNRVNPDVLFDGHLKPQLERMPCSHVALMCATEDMVVPLTVHPPKVDKTGYCKLQDMTAVVKQVFPKVRYIYVKPAFRNTLEHFAAGHEGVKSIICVQGHFIYFNGKDYYSYFDNANDTVIGIWMLNVDMYGRRHS